MDETDLDQILDTALTNQDFGTVRAVLIKKGYDLAIDESEPDLAKIFPLNSASDEENEDETYLLILEKEIRGRQVQTLRNLLSNAGHKITKPDPYLLWAEEEERRKAGRPVYVTQHNTFEM